MLKKVAAWGAALVIVLLAVQLSTRGRSQSGDARETLRPESSPAHDAVRRVSSAAVEAASAGDTHESPVAVALPPAAPPRKFERRFMFDCAGERFFVRIGDGEAALLPALSLTGDWISLAEVGSVWRGRYASEDIVFRKDGDVATLEIGEETLTDCAGTRDRAAPAGLVDGVFFQAFGNRPDWNFEITAQDLTLTTEGGVRTEFPLREPLDNGARFTFRSVLGTQEIVVTVDRIPCYDAAMDETFEHTVAVTFANAWYYGCGRSIRYR